MKREKLVFVVDSYAKRELYLALESAGLKENDSFYITGIDNSEIIMQGEVGERMVDAKKLLVFVSSFGGSLEPAVWLSQKIKEENHQAHIIFRSMVVENSVRVPHPIFDGSLTKDHYDHSALLTIVHDFFKERELASK